MNTWMSRLRKLSAIRFSPGSADMGRLVKRCIASSVARLPRLWVISDEVVERHPAADARQVWPASGPFGQLGQFAPAARDHPADRLADRDQDRLALLPGIGQRVGGDVVDEAAHRLVHRRAAQDVVLLLVERDQVLVGLGDRRPGQLVEQQVAPVLRVGEAGDVDLAQVLVREISGWAITIRFGRGARMSSPRALARVWRSVVPSPGTWVPIPCTYSTLTSGRVADAVAVRWQLVLRRQIGRDPGERPPLDLAVAGVLGLLAVALQHRLRHAPPEALAARRAAAASSTPPPASTGHRAAVAHLWPGAMAAEVPRWLQLAPQPRRGRVQSFDRPFGSLSPRANAYHDHDFPGSIFVIFEPWMPSPAIRPFWSKKQA